MLENEMAKYARPKKDKIASLLVYAGENCISASYPILVHVSVIAHWATIAHILNVLSSRQLHNTELDSTAEMNTTMEAAW